VLQLASVKTKAVKAKATATYSVLFLFLFLFFHRTFVTCNALFWSFGNKGEFKNTEKKSKKSSWDLGSSQKMWLLFRPFLFCFFLLRASVVWFDFFNRVFGRFVTRGVQKRDKKKSRENLLSSQKK
jgi:cytochrome b subunit of formate dehydrogenase